MKRKIFFSIFSISMIAVFFSLSSIFTVMYTQAINNMKREVVAESAYIQAGISLSSYDYLERLKSVPAVNLNNRLTIINPKGTVVYDSISPAKNLGNHLDRPEVKEALQKGTGESMRLSNTMEQQTFYYAVRLEDGYILRLAGSTYSAWTYLKASIPTVLLISLLTGFLASWAANRQTKKIIDPINNLNLESPLQNEAYDELSPLLSRIKKQNKEIITRIKELRQVQEEFSAITSNMKEGLILLNKKEAILSINNSAASFFDVIPVEQEGKSILSIDHSLELQNFLEQVRRENQAEAILSRKGRFYCFSGSQVGKENGLALLIFDITEKLAAEQIRKEFSANVSHELKTPLQVISGYAEIMKSGMVQAEDFPRFSEKIYQEAQRMIQLIEDIIRLSRLDETKLLDTEPVDLYCLAEQVKNQLFPIAQNRGISISLSGSSAMVNGIPRILEDMVFNLIENAVKYNIDGGEVQITVMPQEGKVLLKVSDTGIGIAPQNQERVFERFYREDTSHSKQIEGTGLGLSIVKHGAAIHQASVNLTSVEGKGTEISLLFPAK